MTNRKYLFLTLTRAIEKPCLCYRWIYSITRYIYHNRVLSSCKPHHRTIVTPRVPHVKQELPTLFEHPSSHPVFCWVHVAQSLVVCVVFCGLLFVILSFPLVNVLSVLLRFIHYDFAFDIFNFFLD